MPRVTEKSLKKAILKHRGILSAVAKSCSTSRTTVHKRIRNSERLKAVLREARETFVDDGESALVNAVKNQEHWAVSLLLKTLGKARGYVEKQELGVDGNLTIKIIKFSDCNTNE